MIPTIVITLAVGLAGWYVAVVIRREFRGQCGCSHCPAAGAEKPGKAKLP